MVIDSPPPQVVTFFTSVLTTLSCTLLLMIDLVLIPTIAIMTPKRTQCMTSSSVIQCHAMNTAMKAVIAEPLMVVVERDLSNVKTRWSTVAVAMSMERSSPDGFVSHAQFKNRHL